MKRLTCVLILLLITAPGMAAKKPSLEQRVNLLERRVKTLTELMLRMDSLQREIQQMRGEMEEQNHSLESLKKRQRDLYLDVDQRLSQIGAGGSASVPPATPGSASLQTQQRPPVTSTASVSPTKETSQSTSSVAPGDPALEEQAYLDAYNLLVKQKRYADSRKAFQDFLARYPSGDYADNAQYWLAESSYVEGDFDSALEGFSKVIDQYPDSPKVSDAMLKSGFIQSKMKQWSKAKETLTLLTRRYPGSTASRLASQHLDKMRAEGR